MSMIQKIEIDGKQVPFKVSAAIPRIYRIKFHRDIYKDLDALGKAVGNGDEGSSHLDMFSLEMFENIAYIMAKHADPTIPDSPEEWLDEFSTFSIYQVLPKIIELWGLNVQTDVESKKLHATDRPMTTPLFLLRCNVFRIRSLSGKTLSGSRSSTTVEPPNSNLPFSSPRFTWQRSFL